MVDYGERLDAAMRLRTVSTSMLAKEIGVTYQAIKKVLDGKSAALSAENNARAAQYLKINSYWLATGEDQMSIDIRPSPALTPLQPTAPTVRYIVTLLAAKLQPMDRSIRDVAAVMLKVIAERPEEPATMIDALSALLGEIPPESIDVPARHSMGK